MPAFKREKHKFNCTGLDLRHPPDQMPEGKYPILSNLRVDQQGALTVRKSLVNISGAPIADLSIHSLRRLSNQLPLFPAGGAAILPYTRVAGANATLYTGQTTLASVDAGYSGDPLSLVSCQPLGSQDAWMYVADRSRMRKVRGDVPATNYQMGIAPPTSPPVANYTNPTYFVIETGANAYGAGGTAGAITTPNRFSTTIANILYDSGSAGYACVNPTVMDQTLQPGCLVLADSNEYQVIREVFEPIATTTIASIIYDSGSAGACTIVLAANSSGLRPNAFLRIAGSENVRVLSVTTGPDPALTSFRCISTGSRAAGNSVAGLASFRVAFANSHSAGGTLSSQVNQSTIGVGTGTLSRTIALNLGVIAGRPVTVDDYIHLSIFVDNPNNVIEGRFILDTDPAVNDFAHNYLYKAFRASDLQSNVSGLLTAPVAQQVAAQRQVLGNTAFVQPLDPTQATVPGQGISAGGLAAPSSVQQVTGTGQWSELVIKVGQLIRVGADRSRGLKDVAAVRVQLQVSASTVFAFGSFTIGGTYGRDVGLQGSPLLYAYRYRSSVTGAVSNPSPVLRSGLNPKREQVTVQYFSSSDPQVDQIELFGFGAGLDSWHKVAQVPNANSSYADSLTAIAIATNPAPQFDRFVPFPTTDIPRAGTCNACGTVITQTGGDTFNTAWAPGSLIVVNGITTTVYSVTSSTMLHLVDSVGSAAGVAFSLPFATIQGQSLPAMWGPWGGTETGLYNFAVGDPNDPGLLYWTNANDPDSASDKGFISVTSPAEPMMNGFSVDGYNVAFSSDRVFKVFQSLSGPNKFTTQEIINGSGLFARWAFCYKGTKFWYLSKSGIYQGSLDSLDPQQPITDGDLYPLFPHDGAAPANVAINGVYYPPDFTQTTKLRLSCDEDSVFFLYQDTQGTQRCLRYDQTVKGWFPHDFIPSPLVVHKEEGSGIDSVLAGGNNGILYGLTTSGADDGTPISCRVRTRSYDYGDTRSRKYFGDHILDADPQGMTLNVAIGYDNYSASPDAALPVTGSGRTQQALDIQGGNGFLARNIAADISWSSATGTPILYEWQPAVVDKPELSLKRATDWDDSGISGTKYVRAVLIEADTLGSQRTVNVLGDGGAATGNALSITHAGQTLLPYALTPFNAHLMKLSPQDANLWQLFRAVWIFDPYPEYAPIVTPWSDAGYPGAKWVQGVRLKADTLGIGVDVPIQGDGGALMTTLHNANHNGQQTVPYSWTPFIAHLLRIAPGAEPMRIWEPIDWVFEPMPELTNHWVTQGTTHDLQGYQQMRDFYIALMSTGTVSLVITADSQSATFLIPNTAGAFQKTYINQMTLSGGTWPLKGKLWSYSLTSPDGTGFRLFLKDCEVRLKSWSSAGSYQSVRPFGDISRTNGGARI